MRSQSSDDYDGKEPPGCKAQAAVIRENSATPTKVAAGSSKAEPQGRLSYKLLVPRCLSLAGLSQSPKGLTV